MHIDRVYVDGLSEAHHIDLTQRLKHMIGVKDVSINGQLQCITLKYETPINLNTLEKEIYDAGFKVLRTEKGEMSNE